MRVAPDVVKAVWDRYARELGNVPEREFADGTDEGVDLEGGPGNGSVLRRNGEILEWDDDFDGLRLADDHRAIQSLAIAARRRGELRAALPHRPGNAIDCRSCTGYGFIDLLDHPKYLVCKDCDGLGWRVE